MTLQEWSGLVLTLLSITGILLSGIRWYIGLQFKPVQEAIADIRAETKTNGGSSMRDEIKAIKKENEDARESRIKTNEKLDHMYDILLEYIAKSK